jgi:phosphatidylglycerol:prolipoprotein diacylglycerol transferase
MVLGIASALAISFRLNKYYKIGSDTLFDLFFWLIINGLIGARLYDVFLNLPYYLDKPLSVLKIWQGGLAIHGAIIAGLFTAYFFARQRKLSFWSLAALTTPGLALAQAIGRWGNYFNQELFGLPTNKPWGIPINLDNRPWLYITNNFFQPTFLYESLGCLLIFIILISANFYLIRKNKLNNYYFVLLTALYMVLYSILRFSLEFIRIDDAPTMLSLRWPQIMSLAIILFSLFFIIFNPHAKTKKDKS